MLSEVQLRLRSSLEFCDQWKQTIYLRAPSLTAGSPVRPREMRDSVELGQSSEIYTLSHCKALCLACAERKAETKSGYPEIGARRLPMPLALTKECMGSDGSPNERHAIPFSVSTFVLLYAG